MGGCRVFKEGMLCPFSDETLYSQQVNKAQFWNQSEYFGIYLKGLQKSAMIEKLRQPVIDAYPPSVQ